MPLIPTFKNEAINVKQVNMPEASLAPIKESQRAQGGVVNAIEDAENAIIKVRDFRQREEAGIFVAQRLADIRARASADIDLNSGKYAAEIDQVGSEAAKTISSRLAKDEFFYEFQRQALSAKTSIQQDFRVKELRAAEAALEYKGKNIVDTIGSMDEGTRFTMIASHKKSLQEAVARGIYDQGTADGKWLEFQKKVNKSEIDYDISRDDATLINDSYVYNQLNLGDKGDYQNLTPQERAEAMENIQKKIRRNQIIFTFQDNQNKDQNESQMLVNKVDGNLSPEKVKDALLSGGIRRSFGEKMLKSVYGNPNPTTDYGVYNRVREMQLTDATPQEINQFILDNGDKLSNSDTKFLIDKTMSETDRKQKTIIRYNAEALKNWAKDKLSLMPEVQNDLIYEFHRRVNQNNAQGPAIDAIAQELQKEKIKEIYSPTALLEDVPHFVADRNRLRKVFEKESKLKGKTSPVKSVNATVQQGISFDDL